MHGATGEVAGDERIGRWGATDAVGTWGTCSTVRHVQAHLHTGIAPWQALEVLPAWPAAPLSGSPRAAASPPAAWDGMMMMTQNIAVLAYLGLCKAAFLHGLLELTLQLLHVVRVQGRSACGRHRVGRGLGCQQRHGSMVGIVHLQRDSALAAAAPPLWCAEVVVCR